MTQPNASRLGTDGEEQCGSQRGATGQEAEVRAAAATDDWGPSARLDAALHSGRLRSAPGERAGATQGAGTPARRGALRSALDLEALDTLIVQQWTKTLRGPYDWAEWPLARYVLRPGVLRARERHASVPLRCASPAATRLAWVCAMVACGRAAGLRGLDPRPLRGEAGAGAGAASAEAEASASAEAEASAELVRADGARGWCCNLERDAPQGPQLRYWVHPTGLIEFEDVLAREVPCRG
jgi:hypothetical protein